MTRRASSVTRGRIDLHDRLESRSDEIRESALSRIQQIDPQRKITDPTYGPSLELAVRAAIVHYLEALQRGAGRVAPAPPAVRAQAALAARNGVGLDVVLRRCTSGHALIESVVVEEAEVLEISGWPLRTVLLDHAATFQGLVSAVSQAYAEEERSLPKTSADRKLEQVRRLLAGDELLSTDLDYDLAGYHVAIVLAGTGPADVARAAATAISPPKALIVQPDHGICWAWFGSAQPTNGAQIETVLGRLVADPTRIAIGEPASGVEGWRRSHRQAIAALPIAQRGNEPLAFYRDAPLTAAALGDDLLASSLRQLYLQPLEAEKDGGESLRQTLRSYFACERNRSSAAAALQLARNTLAARLDIAEERIGRPLISCAAGLEVALALQLLDGHTDGPEEPRSVTEWRLLPLNRYHARLSSASSSTASASSNFS